MIEIGNSIKFEDNLLTIPHSETLTFDENFSISFFIKIDEVAVMSRRL